MSPRAKNHQIRRLIDLCTYPIRYGIYLIRLWHFNHYSKSRHKHHKGNNKILILCLGGGLVLGILAIGILSIINRNDFSKYVKNDGKELVNVPDNFAFNTKYTYLQNAFGNPSFDLISNQSFVSQSVKVSPKHEDKGDLAETTYDLDGIKINTQYRAPTISNKNISLGKSRTNPPVKQQIVITNSSSQDKHFKLKLKTPIETDVFTYEGKEYKITNEIQTFKTFEKTASISAFAKDIGKTNTANIKQFENYQHTYIAGGEIQFKTDKGDAEYDWMDVANRDHQVEVYKEGRQAFISLTVAVSAPANGQDIIDPIFTFSSSSNYSVRYDGGGSDDQIGHHGVLKVDDINGDGVDDLIVGGYAADYGGTDRGSVWVVFGGNSPTGIKPFSTTSNYNIRYDGETDGNILTYWGTLDTGDVNGDNISDLIIGSSYANSAYVIFSTLIDDVGTSTGNNKSLGTGTNYNIRYDGEAGDRLTQAGGIKIGDVNGDGYSDLVLGDSLADYNTDNSGSAWVMYSTLIDDVGTSTGNNKILTTSTNYNIRYDGAAGTHYLTGNNDMAIGDVNGDGYSDLVIGAAGADYNSKTDSGSVYVMYSTLVDDNTSTGNNLVLSTSTNYNIRFDGETAYDKLGSVSNIVIGDVNGDTYSDLILGAKDADIGGHTDNGSVWVIFETLIDDVTTTGNSKPLATSTNYNIRYYGQANSDAISLGGGIKIGDLNRDGYSDLVISAPSCDYTTGDAGCAYVMFSTLIDDVGTSTGNSKDFNSGTSYTMRIGGDTSGDYLTNGIGDRHNTAAMAIGDVNGDGYPDLLLGTSTSNYNHTDAGALYVLYSTLLDDYSGSSNSLDLGVETSYSIRYDGDEKYDFLTAEGNIRIGDFSGDGVNDLIVGAPNSNWPISPGTVYIIYSEKTNTTPTAFSQQRKTWYDGTRYWKAYHNDIYNRIEFWYSTDGLSWTENTGARILVDTNDFSIQADSSYAYITYTNNFSILARSASSYPGTSFTWSIDTTVYAGTTETDAYQYPNITKDTNSKIWISATYVTGTNATYYADVDDGYIDGVNASYTTANSTSSGCGTSLNKYNYAGQQYTGGNYYVYRSYIRMDSSGIPDGTNVLSAKVYLKTQRDESLYDLEVNLYQYNWQSPLCTYQETNYDGAYGTSATYEGNILKSANMSTDTYYNISVKPSLVSKTGSTYYSIVSTVDENKYVPPGNNYVYFYNADTTGTTSDPYLYVTYGNYAITVKQATNANDITAWQSPTTVDAASTNANKYSVLASKSSGNIYAVWKDGTAIEGKLYNGSAWDAGATSIATGTDSLTQSISAVSDSSGNVHLVYIDSSNYTTYQEHTSSWQTAVTLDGNSGNAYPTITVNTSDDSVYAFWIRGSHIYYKKGVSTYTSGNWDASATDWQTNNDNIWVTSNYSGSNNVFAYWTVNSANPYPTQWDKITQIKPTICTLEVNTTNTAIVINWNDLNSTETGYVIEKSTDGAAFSSLTTTAANTTTYNNNSSVSTGHTYAYRIKATGTFDSEWCTTSTLTLGTGSLLIEGIQIQGIKVD